MVSSVLNGEPAIQVNFVIMRAFAKLREILATHKDLALKLDAPEKKYERYEVQIKGIFDAIRNLMVIPREAPRRRIGFLAKLANHQ